MLSQIAIPSIPKNILEQCTQICLMRGDKLLSKGGEVAYVYYLLSGKVKIYDLGIDGEISRVVWVGPGQTVGEMETLSGNRFAMYAAQVHEDGTRMLKMKAQHYVDWIKADHEFCFETAVTLSKKLNNTALILCRFMRSDALAIIREYLFETALAEHSSDSVIIKQTRQEIADNCGISERTVNRCIARLKQMDEVCVLKGKIKISQKQINDMMKLIR